MNRKGNKTDGTYKLAAYHSLDHRLLNHFLSIVYDHHYCF